MNEDVFAAPAAVKTVDSDIQEVTEQIHRLLLQVSSQRGGGGGRGANEEFERFLSLLGSARPHQRLQQPPQNPRHSQHHLLQRRQQRRRRDGGAGGGSVHQEQTCEWVEALPGVSLFLGILFFSERGILLFQRTFQEICQGVHLQKNQEQQAKKKNSGKISSEQHLWLRRLHLLTSAPPSPQ